MNLAVGALIVLLVLLAVGLAATAAPPAPASALSQSCASDAGCPPPQTCDTGTRTCRDVALPAKLAAAQSDAAALLAAAQKLAALLGAGESNYLASMRAFVAWVYSGSKLSAPPGLLSAASSAVSGAGLALASYLNNTLAAPGCPAGGTASCGYCAAVAALTPASPKSQFMALGLSVPALVVQLGGVAQATGAAVDAVNNVADSLNSQYSATYGAPTIYDWYTDASTNMALATFAVTSLVAQLQTLANSATQSGQELYIHFAA